MPLILLDNHSNECELGIWRITEEPEYFSSKLDLFEEEKEELLLLSNRKKIEWLSSRFLLHSMSGRSLRGRIIKDRYGKPFIDNSDHHISISHSRDLAAVIASKRVVGIDIQYIVPKILRIGERFISQKEISTIPKGEEILYHHIFWGGKECLFKAYGKGNVDFRKDLEIKDIEKKEGEYQAIGIINKQDFKRNYRLYINDCKDYILVYAVEI